MTNANSNKHPARNNLNVFITQSDTEYEKYMFCYLNVLKTFKEQQRKDDPKGPYKFQRKTERALDTMTNDGWGNPVKPIGLIASAFRPSDDI